MSLSLLTIFGVVPEAIKAWNPDSAPHMITMHTKGQTEPGTTGPPPDMKGVVAGMCNGGCATKIPTASSPITPIFMYEVK